MIIDSHTHIGEKLNFYMPTQMLLEAMADYKIDFALVMNILSMEVDHKQVMIPSAEQVTQLKSAKEIVKISRQNPNRIGCLLWLKPLTETVTDELEQFIKANQDVIYGLKFHPYHSKLAFNDERMLPYFELATRLNFPIVTHTASDEYSHPKHVYEIAKKYPHLKFVMVHMGLGTDHEEAIELISKLPNLYGDSTWIKPEKVLKAIEVCGAHKIMFGSDAPINGVNTYDDDMFYNFYFNEMKNVVSSEIYEDFMGKTAMKVFNIEEKGAIAK